MTKYQRSIFTSFVLVLLSVMIILIFQPYTTLFGMINIGMGLILGTLAIGIMQRLKAPSNRAISFLEGYLMIGTVLGALLMIMPARWFYGAQPLFVAQVHFLIATLVAFSCLGFFFLTQHMRINSHRLLNTSWRWRNYLVFIPIAIPLLTLAILCAVSMHLSALTTWTWIVGILLIIPLQSMVEEIQFRGAFMGALADKNPSLYRVIAAILTQSCVFGLMHLNIAWIMMPLGLLSYWVMRQCNLDYPILLTLGFTTAFIAVALICHMVTLSMIVGVLCAQGVFGLAAGIIAWRTRGIEVSSFWHALNNCCLFIISLGALSTGSSSAIFFSWQTLCVELVIASIMVGITLLFAHMGWLQKEHRPLRKEIDVARALHKRCKEDLKSLIQQWLNRLHAIFPDKPPGHQNQNGLITIQCPPLSEDKKITDALKSNKPLGNTIRRSIQNKINQAFKNQASVLFKNLKSKIAGGDATDIPCPILQEDKTVSEHYKSDHFFQGVMAKSASNETISEEIFNRLFPKNP